MRDPKIQFVQFGFHPEWCIGCGACVTACIDEHNTDVDEQPPLRRIARLEEHSRWEDRIHWYSFACMHCKEHPCVEACPKDCFSLDKTTGTVQLDASACIGCKSCAKVCRYSGIVFDQQKKAHKCDGCMERLERGLLPRCVEACPRYAITVDDRPALRAQKLSELAAVLKSGKLI